MDKIKIKISVLGILVIKREKMFKAQECPYSNNTDKYCSDTCPLFSEPGNRYDEDGHIIGGGYLSLCNNKMLYFDEEEFVDERE